MGYPTTTQDSLPVAGQALPDGLSTRRVPTKGFKLTSCLLSSSSKLRGARSGKIRQANKPEKQMIAYDRNRWGAVGARRQQSAAVGCRALLLRFDAVILKLAGERDTLGLRCFPVGELFFENVDASLWTGEACVQNTNNSTKCGKTPLRQPRTAIYSAKHAAVPAAAKLNWNTTPPCRRRLNGVGTLRRRAGG